MLALDYLVYDNRTWTAGIGRDWGVKNATGALSGRDDLRWLFERYCGLLSGDRGYLGGFDRALGGVRPRNGNGYLLCVTVETPDAFGRPSWAVYGLWCPDPQSLESVLATDVVGAVQSAVRSSSPESSIVLTAPAPMPAPLRFVAATPVYRRFGAQKTLAEVRALLLGAIRQRRELPTILGITASSRLAAAGEEFDVVYCHPADERAQQAFDELRSGDDPFEYLVETAPATAPVVRAPRHSHAARWSLAVCFALAVAAGIARSPFVQREIALRGVAAQVTVIRELEPAELLSLTQRGDDRAVREACAELIQQQQLIAGPSVGASPERALDAQPLVGPPCHVLQMAYPTDFEDPHSTARRWCDSFAKLERTARTLRAASGRTRSS
ncbi:MAG TPA: hypothetical protein VGF48_10715 [Thermoanaerobaculia bacterium]|jgi:hypothetical protein